MRKLIVTVLILVSSTAISFGFTAGVYVEPKLSFLAKKETFPKKFNTLSAGGGLAMGYDFFKATRFLPLRIDLEYIGRGEFIPKASSFHTLMVNVYYDVNLFSMDKTLIKDTTLSTLYEKDPFMALFLVVSFGGRYKSTTMKIPEGTETPSSLVLYQHKETASSFLFGVGAGGVFNFNKIMGATLTYRFFVGPKIKDGHEVLVGLRFTVPRSAK